MPQLEAKHAFHHSACDSYDAAGDDGQGRGQAHSLLQLSANPISSLCCALVATRSSSVSHQTGSFAPGGDASPSGRKLSGSNSSDDSPSPAAQYSGQQGRGGTSCIAQKHCVAV